MNNDNTATDIEAQTDFRKEIEAILPGKDVFGNLDVRQTGFNQYKVISARNSGLTLHTVDLQRPSCTCDDWQYNTDTDRQICAHYAAAFLKADDVDLDELMLADLSNILNTVDNYRDKLETILNTAEKATVEARSASAEAQETVAENNESLDPDELIERFEDTLEAAGYEVHFANKSGDELAFSVGHDEFNELKRITSECDLVGYDGDVNKIPMGDVQTYLDEVV